MAISASTIRTSSPSRRDRYEPSGRWARTSGGPGGLRPRQHRRAGGRDLGQERVVVEGPVQRARGGASRSASLVAAACRQRFPNQPGGSQVVGLPVSLGFGRGRRGHGRWCCLHGRESRPRAGPRWSRFRTARTSGIDPPGEDGLCSLPFGTTNRSPWRRLTVRSPPASRSTTSNWPSSTRKKLVGVLVHVPDVVAAGVGDSYVVVIDPADDPRAVNVAERGQRLVQVHRFGCHDPGISGAGLGGWAGCPPTQTPPTPSGRSLRSPSPWHRPVASPTPPAQRRRLMPRAPPPLFQTQPAWAAPANAGLPAAVGQAHNRGAAGNPEAARPLTGRHQQAQITHS